MHFRIRQVIFPVLFVFSATSCGGETIEKEKPTFYINDTTNIYEINFEEGDSLKEFLNYNVEDKTIVNFYSDDTFLTKLNLDQNIISGATYYALTESNVDVINISTAEEFKEIKKDGNYRLINDIDFGGEEISLNFNYYEPFAGYFNGNGHYLKNYKLPDKEYSGLFGCVEGTIFNVKTSVDFTSNLNNATYISPLVGYLKGGLIRECSSYGSVSINTNKKLGGVYLGGIVARNDKGKILLSENFSNLSNFTNVNAFTGGICAYNGGGKPFESEIKYSYSQTNYIVSNTNGLNTSAYSGGISGFNFGLIDSVFSKDDSIKARSYQYQAFGGALVADNNGGKVNNSFSLSNVEVLSDSGYVFSGNTIGRNFKSSLEEDSGTFNNVYGYDGQNILAYNGSTLSLKEKQFLNSLTFEEITSLEFYKKLGFDKVFNLKEGYLPSLYSSFNLGEDNTQFIEIESVEDFFNIENNLNGKYKLMNDIVIEMNEYSPIGSYQSPFSGTLIGNNHTITYTVNSSSKLGQDGLFGYLNGVVKDLNIVVKGNIENNSSNIVFGGLSGFATKSYINNVDVKYDLAINSKGLVFGGIIGINEESTIYQVKSEGKLNAKLGDIESYIGGLVGRNSGYVYETASLTNLNITDSSKVYVGGLTGKNHKFIDSSYAISEIDASLIKDEKSIGGFTGANFDLGKITNSYSKSIIKNNREAKINLIGGFSGDNLKTIDNCYYNVNQEIKYSAGESLVFTNVERVNDDELSTLASKLNDKFISGNNGYPILKFEESL